MSALRRDDLSVGSLLLSIQTNRAISREQREKALESEIYQRIYKGKTEPKDPRYGFLWSKEVEDASAPTASTPRIAFQGFNPETIQHASVSQILVAAVQTHSADCLRRVLDRLRALWPYQAHRPLLSSPLPDIDVTALHVAVRSYAVQPHNAPLRDIYNKMIGLLLEAGADYSPCQRSRRIASVNGQSVGHFADDGVSVFELCKGDTPSLLQAYIGSGQETFVGLLHALEVEDTHQIAGEEAVVRRLNEIKKNELATRAAVDGVNKFKLELARKRELVALENLFRERERLEAVYIALQEEKRSAQQMSTRLTGYWAERTKNWADSLDRNANAVLKKKQSIADNYEKHDASQINEALLCPNVACAHHANPTGKFYRNRGYRIASCDGQRIARYQCKTCRSYFCATQGRPSQGQHRPDMNSQVFQLATSGVPLRQLQRHLKCSERTVARKVGYLATQSQRMHQSRVKGYKASAVHIEQIPTYIYSRHQSAVVMVAVADNGKVLGWSVGRIPCADHKEAIKRNWTQDESAQAICQLLTDIAPRLTEGATIHTPQGELFTNALKECITVSVRHEHAPTVPQLGKSLARFQHATMATSKNMKGLHDHLWLWVASTNGYEIT